MAFGYEHRFVHPMKYLLLYIVEQMHHPYRIQLKFYPMDQQSV